MKTKNLNIEELVKLRTKMILENHSEYEIDNINFLIWKKEKDYSNYLKEDGSTGGPGGAVMGGGEVSSTGTAYATAGSPGMGPITSAQPSILPGHTIGLDSGTEGSGDISIPFSSTKKNSTDPNKIVSQKIPAPMGKEHGARTGKKSRDKKLSLKDIKNVFAKKQDYTTNASPDKKRSKIMSFQNFQKDSITKVTKVSQ